MTHWVWVPEPFDVWFGPYESDVEAERDALQQHYTTVGLEIVEDSKLVRRRIEVSSMPLPEED